MPLIRLVQRSLLLTLHVLLGMAITPFILSRQGGGRLRTNRRVTSWWHNRLADILGLRVVVSGYRPQAPALLVSNHVSWMDIVVLGGLTHTDFLSKYEVRRWPLIGWLAAMAGTLFIRRGHGQAAMVSDQIAGRLRQRGVLTLFPEGTTTDGRTVRPFFSRLFAAAVETGTDVVPVALRYHIDGAFDPVAPYTGDQPLLDSLRGLLLRERSEVRVIFGEPIALQGRSRKELAEAARAAIVAALPSPEQAPLHLRHVQPLGTGAWCPSTASA